MSRPTRRLIVAPCPPQPAQRRRQRRIWPALLVAALCTSPVAPAFALLFDDDKDPPEVEWPNPAPAPPDLTKLINYSRLEGESRQRDAFDPASIVVIEPSAVRLTVVVTSASGTPNISHEAFRCTTLERKMLATGRRDGQWAAVSQPSWQKLDARNNATPSLKPLYLAICDGSTPRTSASQIRERLNDLSSIKN